MNAKRIHSFIFPFLLILTGLVLAIQNYTPHTYLSGWDTLHPEFNFPEYFRRVIFGVWQDHQGLGAVASQAHASELPRLIVYFLSSLVLPKEFLRYAYIFACLILGPLGVFYFLRKLGQTPAFLASLFYLLNLVTVQQFFVPFEMFATHYASLPWIFLLIVDYLKKQDRKTLIIFTLVSLFSSSIAHTATLWYSYFSILLLFLLVCNLVDKGKNVRKASINLLVVTLAVNSFWLLPNLYFILNHAKEVGNSKIHTLFTEEAFAQNASFGNLESLGLFKNFLFNWGQYVGNDKFEPLLSQWSQHLAQPLVSILGYGFFGVIILGIYNSIKLKSKISLPMLAVFLISAFFWLNINPPLGFLFQIIQDHFPLFKEAFRFPFTKFSIVLIFSSTFFFAFGVLLLEKVVQKYSKYAKFIILIVISASLFYYSLPAFKGNLIDPFMRTSIPKEYFDLFTWFDKQPDGRIAPFPIHSFWGWSYYDFGGQHGIYQGAGFIWFGIRQPILDREFDRWQTFNEEYYREMSQALYTQNLNSFRDILTKYDISYLLIDKNVIAPQTPSKVLFFNELEAILRQLGVKPAAQFGKNITVYKIPSNNSIYTISNIKNVSPKLASSYEDFAFEEYGPYITGSAGNKGFSKTLFPLRNLIDNENRIAGDLLKLTQEGILVDLKDTKVSELNLPNFEDIEKAFAVDLVVEKQSNTLKIDFNPKFPKSRVPLETFAILPPDQKNFLLSINQKDNFILNNLAENTPLSLGTVFLNTDTQNSISIYQDRDDYAVTPNFSNINFSLSPCEESAGTFGVNPNANSFTLFGKNASPCLEIPLSNIFPQADLQTPEYLLGVSFVNQNTDNSSFCISQQGQCVNYKLKNIYTIPLSSDRTYSYFGIKSEGLQNTNLKFLLNSTDSTQKTTYSEVQFSLKKPIFHLEFSKDVLSLSLDTLKTSGDKTFLIPFSGISDLSRDITQGLQTSGDCQNNPGLISPPKREILKQSFKNYIRYTAWEGSFCDHFSYRNLSSAQAYLLIIQSRNIKGLPIRLCVTNPITKRCDIYTHLSSSNEFVNNVFLLPPMQIRGLSSSLGFDININNFAIKNIPAVNDIASINVVPFPYNWLSRIETNPTVTNPKERPVKFEKVNKSLYRADTADSQGMDVLVLSQSYEQGWHAYKTDNFLFPFFSGELNDHLLVNSWANGWALDGYNGKVTIVFLPQYLEYLGFGVLILGVIYLIKKKSLS